MLGADKVKPSRAFIYRQATAKAELRVFNDNGWLKPTFALFIWHR